MTAKIVITYNDGVHKGKQVVTTETWEGNAIPLAKLIKVMEADGMALSKYNKEYKKQ